MIVRIMVPRVKTVRITIIVASSASPMLLNGALETHF